MSLTMDLRPNRWVRSCLEDGSAFDYCGALGMGDFITRAWGLNAADNNAIVVLKVIPDPNGLIASIDTTPNATLYDPNGTSGSILSMTSTTTAFGTTTYNYTPLVETGAGHNIVGLWSVEILGMQVTLVTGDVCVVNFNQNFNGGAGNLAPVITDAEIDGIAIDGEILTATYTYIDSQGDAQDVASTVGSIRWYSYTNFIGATGQTLLSSGSLTYEVQAADAGKYIGFSITPYALTGTSPGTEEESIRVLVPFEILTLSTTKQTAFQLTLTCEIAIIAWGDGQYSNIDHNGVSNSVQHTYASAGTYNVSIYTDPTTFTAINVNSQQITGTIDASAASALISLSANSNTSMTTILIDTAGSFVLLSAISSGLTGLVGLTNIPAFASGGAVISVNGNAAVTGLDTIASTGKVALSVQQCGITGSFDVSDLNLWSIFRAESNTGITGFVFKSSIPEPINTFYVNSCNVTGTLDLTPFERMGGDIRMNGNPLLTVITPPTTYNSPSAVTRFQASDCDIAYFDMTGFTWSAAVVITLGNNALTAAEMNAFLVDFDTVLPGVGTGTITMAGTNAAPDTTSGGLNGSAAKTSLQGKGYTVTTN